MEIPIHMLFSVLTAIFKKWRMISANKQHILKQHGAKPKGMDFPGDSSIFSKKIITIKMRQNLGNFGTKRVKR